jgi:tetratricopeptide (TPR) repeat protein
MIMNFIIDINAGGRAGQAAGVPCAGGTMKKYLHIIAVLFAIGLLAAPLCAQITGTVTGVAKDKDGKPIAGATVELVNTATGTKYELKTNSKGAFYSVGIGLGTYHASLIKDGQVIDEHGNVVVEASGEREIPFDLAKDAAPTNEQQQKAAAAQKQSEKIKGLNASLQQAKQLEGAGNYDQAVTVLQQATQVDPSQDLVWAYLGDAQRGAGAHATDAQAKTKDYQDAAESYQKALAIKPNNGPYLGQLADAYAKSGQSDKAVETYAAAAQADPTNASAYYYNQGAVLTNTGKVDDAIAAFDKSIQLDPTRAAAYYWKGVNLIGKATMKDNKMVAPDGTAAAFNKYLELAPTGQYADAAKQMLASIGASVETSYGKPKSSKK